MHRAPPACLRSATTRGCAWMRSAAHPGCIRRATPARTAMPARTSPRCSMRCAMCQKLRAPRTSTPSSCCCATRTIRNRSSPKAAGPAASCRRRAATAGSGTTRCSSTTRWAAPPPNSTPTPSTRAAIAASRWRRCGRACTNSEFPMSLATPPLSLYVHLPWCVRKCPYCDFNSHQQRGALPFAAYVDALVADLDQDLPLAWGRVVNSVFFGGGTPSLFPPEAIDAFLQQASARLRFAPGLEITLETNPGTAEHGRFDGYRDAGVNRLSFGIQSFDDACLQRLGRIHDSREADAAVKLAQDAGFDNINLDLMYALPGQTLEMAVRDVERAIALAPAHLSHYQLTLEPNTVFAARPPQGIPDEDASWDMQEHCQALLAAAGYAQYEVSAYARPGRQSAHNLNY